MENPLVHEIGFVRGWRLLLTFHLNSWCRFDLYCRDICRVLGYYELLKETCCLLCNRLLPMKRSSYAESYQKKIRGIQKTYSFASRRLKTSFYLEKGRTVAAMTDSALTPSYLLGDQRSKVGRIRSHSIAPMTHTPKNSWWSSPSHSFHGCLVVPAYCSASYWMRSMRSILNKFALFLS